MQTRIINTKLYRDKRFRELNDKDKFLIIYLLTNEFLEAFPAVEIELDLLAFHCSTTADYLSGLILRSSYFQIFYIEGCLIIGDLFTYANYKGGKTSEKKKKLFNELPDKVKEYIDSEGNIAQLLGNDCPMIEHINHKSEIIKHKSEIRKEWGIEKLRNGEILKQLKTEFIGIDIDREILKMINYIESRGKQYKNYLSFARNWLLNTNAVRVDKTKKREPAKIDWNASPVETPKKKKVDMKRVRANLPAFVRAQLGEKEAE